MKTFNSTLAILGLLFGMAFTPLELAYANANQGVAKVIVVKGTATAILKDGSKIEIKKDQWLPEGATVETQNASFVKLLFIDKSTMNVAPKSSIEIATFPKTEPGVINLISGEIRSKVTKNYLDIKDQDKSKLFIKTKTAAMGVRGTDYVVGFQPSSGETNLDVISGSVAMASLTEGAAFDQKSLEAAVSSPAAVMVVKGMTSAIPAGAKRPLPPAPIPPAKLENLKANENAVSNVALPGAGKDEAGGEQKQAAKEDKKETKQEKSVAKSETKSEAKTETKTETKTESKADAKSTTKSETKTAAAPAAAPAKSATLAPGLSANVASNKSVGATSESEARAPASVAPTPTSAPPPSMEMSNTGPVTAAVMPDGSAPPPSDDGVPVGAIPACTDMCACYNVGCNIADASNPATLTTDLISDGAAGGTTTVTNPTSTVRFNITTQ